MLDPLVWRHGNEGSSSYVDGVTEGETPFRSVTVGETPFRSPHALRIADAWVESRFLPMEDDAILSVA